MPFNPQDFLKELQALMKKHNVSIQPVVETKIQVLPLTQLPMSDPIETVPGTDTPVVPTNEQGDIVGATPIEDPDKELSPQEPQPS